jgi:hypothetical protein
MFCFVSSRTISATLGNKTLLCSSCSLHQTWSPEPCPATLGCCRPAFIPWCTLPDPIEPLSVFVDVIKLRLLRKSSWVTQRGPEPDGWCPYETQSRRGHAETGTKAMRDGGETSQVTGQAMPGAARSYKDFWRECGPVDTLISDFNLQTTRE